MPQTLESLADDLKRDSIRPLYLLSGDEPLLVAEAAEAVVVRAKSLGYIERQIVFAEDANKFRFAYLREQAGAASLFESKRILDVRLPRAQLDRSAADALVSYIERPAPDVCVLVRTSQLDARQRNTAWFKRLSQAAYTVLIWPLKERELVPWLSRRAAKTGFRMSRDAVRFLAMQVEGNLLAAAQEIDKLSIMVSEGDAQEVSLEQVRSEVANSSHFSGFSLLDAAFEGSGRRVHRLLRNLRLEGEEPIRLLGLVLSQLRMLRSSNQGRLPAMKRRAMERTFQRIGERGIDELLLLAEHADHQIKGFEPGDAWQTIELLLLQLSGNRVIERSHD